MTTQMRDTVYHTVEGGWNSIFASRVNEAFVSLYLGISDY